jgi:DNA-binding MarR family transcriptional regulator
LERIDSLLVPDYRGPRAGFTEAHVLKALLTIESMGKIGRGKLGVLLELGQGEVRTLIKRLKDAGFIKIEDRGCSLTSLGRKEHARITKLIPWSFALDAKTLGLGSSNWGVNVRGKSSKIKKGIEQRDDAVKAGANGALTVIYNSDKFIVPPDNSDVEGKNRAEPWTSIRSFGVIEGDVIIISGSKDILSAEYGALSAALGLLQSP